MLVYTLPGPRTTRSAISDRLEGLGQRRRPGRRRARRADGRRSVAVIGDSPAHPLAALQLGVQHDALERRRQHPAAHFEHARRLLHGALEVAGHLGQGGHEEVAEAVALQAAVSGKRYWNRRLMSDSSSARATRQLRMSPGGSTPMPLRSRPELPPSSATVTTAVRLLVCCLRPLSSAAKPLPRRWPRSAGHEPGGPPRGSRSPSRGSSARSAPRRAHPRQAPARPA